MKKKKIGFNAIAVAAVIDLNGRVLARNIVDNAITGESFLIFLDEVGKFTQNRKSVILVDNLAVHRMSIVKERARLLNIELCYNGIYSSTFQPIERNSPGLRPDYPNTLQQLLS